MNNLDFYAVKINLKIIQNMKITKAYKYPLYPNKKQTELIEKTFGCVRFVWNRMLNDIEENYKKYHKLYRIYPSKYKDEFEWLKEVDSKALCFEQLCIEKAYRDYFKNPGAFSHPRNHTKKDKVQSYKTCFHTERNSFVLITNNCINVPKLGMVKIRYYRRIPDTAKIKNAIISRNSIGKYFISIVFEYEKEVISRIDVKNAVGLDYSSGGLYVDSNGNVASCKHFYKEIEKKIIKQEKKLSCMTIGSSNWKKQQIKVNKYFLKAANQRKDSLNKISSTLVKTYDVICIEDINLANMSQNLSLGKSTMDNGFGLLKRMLQYKTLEYGKALITIDKYYPSSKKCNSCGYINRELSLDDRKWKCPKCGKEHDRDINAAINIRERGICKYIKNVTKISNPWDTGDSSLTLSSLEDLSEKVTKVASPSHQIVAHA